MFIIVFLSCLFAFVYNATSRKGIPLIRKEVRKNIVSDSALFSSLKTHSPSDSSYSPYDTVLTEVPVIAPLHQKALRNQDSMASLYPEEQQSIINIVSLAQAEKILEMNRAIIIDAREEESFKQGHIKNAWNVPGLNVDNYFEKFVQLPRDTMILLYCNNPECHLSRLVGDFLGVLGFTNLYHYEGGFDEWMRMKMPYVKSGPE